MVNAAVKHDIYASHYTHLFSSMKSTTYKRSSRLQFEQKRLACSIQIKHLALYGELLFGGLETYV